MENIIKYKLTNGEEVGLKLTFAFLFKLKRTNKELYDEYNSTLFEKPQELEDFLIPIYVAYLCANEDNSKKYSKEEFYELVDFDVYDITRVTQALMTKSKQFTKLMSNK